MAIMGYLGETGVIAGGSIRFDGQELVGASAKDSCARSAAAASRWSIRTR